jgi:hypothetical protein
MTSFDCLSVLVTAALSAPGEGPKDPDDEEDEFIILRTSGPQTNKRKKENSRRFSCLAVHTLSNKAPEAVLP